MDENISKTEKITNLYKKLTYFDDYSSSILVFVIITLVVILVCVYCYVMIRSETIKRDWVNQRCNPNIIPFAGLINKPDNMSATEYTSENFRYCTQTVLKNVSNAAVSPYTDILGTLTNMSGDFTSSMNDAREITSTIRKNLSGASNIVVEKVEAIITPLKPLFDAVNTVFAKTNGLMSAFLHTINGLYLTLKSLIGSIAELCVDTLVIMAAAVLVLWAIAAFFIPAVGLAIPATVAYGVLATMLVPLLIFMKSASTVKTSVCFDKNTTLVMNDGHKKTIVDVQVGDVLSGTNVVTAKLKLSAAGAKMYQLDGVIVSDSHTVLYKDKWILVSKHPDAVKIDNYVEPYIYCLNTSSKQIFINDTCFADWDEIYTQNHFDCLKPFLVENAQKCKKNAGLTSSIHESMDSGFPGNTNIQLQDGSTKEIYNIQVGDILLQGEKVYGLVEIKADDLKQYKYNFGKNVFIDGGPNLTICDPKIAFVSTLHIGETNRVLKRKQEHKLYHVLTDKQTFHYNGICFYDYNASIDLFLHHCTF